MLDKVGQREREAMVNVIDCKRIREMICWAIALCRCLLCLVFKIPGICGGVVVVFNAISEIRHLMGKKSERVRPRGKRWPQ